MKKAIWSVFSVCLLVGLTSTLSQAAVTPCMPNGGKNLALSYAVGNGSSVTAGTLKIALYLQSGATWGATSTVYSTTGELATAYGYTQAGNTLTTCSVTTTTAASAADFTCTGGLVWTVSGGGSIGPADAAIIYNTSISNDILGIYTFTSATATGTGATFTITLPTISTGTRGVLYISELDKLMKYNPIISAANLYQ